MIQTKELSHEEKVEMYNQCSKEELIIMLIEANNVLTLMANQKRLDYQVLNKNNKSTII